MKLVYLALIALFTASPASAGYYIYACGSTADRTHNYIKVAPTMAKARTNALRACQQNSGRPGACVEPVCRKVFQATKVSELPKEEQRRIARQQEEFDRHERAERARRNSPTPPRSEPTPPAKPERNTSPGSSCKTNRDCYSSQYCAGNQCFEKSDTSSSGGGSCKQNRDCYSSEFCVSGQCFPKTGSSRGSCTVNRDCYSSEFCVSGECYPR
ncbi:MAG: hypothetical protein EOP11_13575 [Proteobacteria bacterium]|nr:MAG: hypothetical protein EOP11_13575 [Pseudomonadota bacterium]